jgi:Zn-dependent peptidase ImmA (M78 family)/transcriptional regulator with XRE-family HTH domain
MQNQTIPINPAILQWARVEAGLSLKEAADRARLTSPKKRKGEDLPAPVERLAAWENGQDRPSFNQLKQIAYAYRRPVLTFFLPEPPAKADALTDFRSISDNAARRDSPEFSALKRRIISLHRELRTLAKEEKSPELAFVGSLTIKTPVSEIVQEIRKVLGFTFQEQNKMPSEDNLLKILRERADAAGIFVLFEGNLGSAHSNISPDEFRGIALADTIAPLIAINPNDVKPARVFTFMHELAHIWLGNTGISNTNAFNLHQAAAKAEQLCNAVAAEFLLPADRIISSWIRPDSGIEAGKWPAAVDRTAKIFKVSGPLVSRRLADNKLISNDEYGRLISFYQERWRDLKDKQKKEGSPNRNILDAFRLGRKTIRTLVGAAQAGRISLLDAARILNIPVGRFDKVL